MTPPRSAASRTEPDPQPPAALVEPDVPAPDREHTYEATYGMIRGDRYLAPGEHFQAYPTDPRVLAGQARLVEGEQATDEQRAAIAEALDDKP